MSEMVTYPSGALGKNVVSDVEAWTDGGWTVVLNGTGGLTEDRRFVFKALTLEQVSIDGVYELSFYAGTSDEEKVFSQRFAKGQYPFTISIRIDRVFPGGTQIKVKLQDSQGSGTVFFSIQYEADPGNVRAS
jgi:hypothetical protein